MTFEVSTTKTKLTAFKRRKKFSDAEWKKRGLLPSSAAVSATLEALFNELASRLIAATGQPAPSLVAEGLLRQALSDVDRGKYDTEEAEFVCTLFASLAKIFELKFGQDLNSWLYGEPLGKALSEQAEREANPKVIQTISQLCTKCGAVLKTEITSSRSDNNSESWLSVECASCAELNFLVLPPTIGSMLPNGYRLKTQYWRNKFNRETAAATFKEEYAKQAKKSTSKWHKAA